MSKEELIYALLENNLNQFCFSVCARYNEAGELEYSVSPRGTRSIGYEHLMYIGGIPDFDYTYESIEYSLVDALECYYNLTWL